MSYPHGRFEDALFQQTQQIRFLETNKGRSYMDGFQRDWAGKRRLYYGDGSGLWKVTYETLRRADPIYVSSDVTEIIDTAMESFEPEPIIASDPFVPCGFAYLPRSIRRPDRRGKENGVRALAWIPARSDGTIALDDDPYTWKGLWLSFFSHESDANGEEILDFRKVHPLFELQYLHGTFMPFEEPGWEIGMGADAESDETLDPELLAAAGREQWVFPQVMWRIGQQVVPTQERPARPVRRDSARHGLPRDEISVLRLRRGNIRYEGDPEGEVAWTHRWLRSGHWRWQHYASLGPASEPGTHRQIWINPTVCGPEDKPLIIKDRAVEFTR